MRKFTMDQMLTAFQLEQLLYDFAEELDQNGGVNVEQFYTEDAEFITPGGTIKTSAGIRGFYENRNAMVKKLQKDGQRTGRHTFVNVRCHIHDDDNATLYFTNVNYAGEGAPPVPGLQGPSAIADCRMECRREAGGNWRFSVFAPSQALVGEDDFMKKMLSLSKQ